MVDVYQAYFLRHPARPHLHPLEDRDGQVLAKTMPCVLMSVVMNTRLRLCPVVLVSTPVSHANLAPATLCRLSRSILSNCRTSSDVTTG